MRKDVGKDHEVFREIATRNQGGSMDDMNPHPEANDKPEPRRELVSEPSSEVQLGPDSDLPGQRDMSQVAGALSRIRSRARLMLVSSRCSVVLATVLAAAIGGGLIDFVLRFPIWLRTSVWLAAMVALGWAMVRYIVPAWRFSPSLTDLALRIERHEPKLGGLLASAIDFSRGGDASRPASESRASLADGLARRVVAQAGRRWAEAPAHSIMRKKPLAQRASALVAVVALGSALLAWSPGMWLIGAQRVLTPWSGATWPKRTGIANVTQGDVHALGTALPLRAALTKTARSPESAFVAVRYRLVVGGRQGTSRRELLTWQGRDVDLADGSGRSGALFERLLEPVGDAIEYRFESEDDQTPWKRVRLIEPPEVVSAHATITPPEYAAQVLAARDVSDDPEAESTSADPMRIDLGPGTDERAIAPASLAGSVVEMTLMLNRDVELPADLRETIEGIVVRRTDEREWQLAWALSESARVPIKLVDEYGIESIDEVVYRFEALADRPPAATITQPESDRSVLATAVIDVVGEGRDDVGLSWVNIEQEIWKPAGREGSEPSGPGGALKLHGEAVELARIGGEGLGVATAMSTLELTELDLLPGDEVRVTAIVQDLLGAMTTGAEPTRSVVRRLRVISETEFIDEIQEELREVRQRAQSIEERQNDLRERTEGGENNSETRRGQAQITERVARQRDRLDEISSRVRENALDDSALEQLLDEARGRVSDAGAASSRASQELEAAKERLDEEQEDGEQSLEERAEQQAGEAKEAIESQRDVQDELQNLIDLLDRGEDNWAIKIGAQRLLRDQQELREQTQQAGQQTAGKTPEELTPEERSELDEIVKKQNELASEMDDLVKEMRDRENELRENDPGAAQAMASAASRAEQQQTSQTMRDAAQQAGENQTARAQDQQAQAEEDIEELIKNLEQGDRARKEMLKRALKSIIESLESVIEAQKIELARLDERDRQSQPIADLDAGMIGVNRNTLGVLDLAQGSGPELGPVVNLLERAGDAQAAAISELRFPMALARSVREHEQRSLDLMTRALEEAREMEENLDEQQREDKLRELRSAYRGILEAQVALRETTEPLTQVDALTRRDRVALRGLADQQEVIRDDLAALLRDSVDLTESGVFRYAHDRLDRQCNRAIDAMTGARPRRAVRAQKSVERALRGILEALKDVEPDDSPFDEPEGPEGGGNPEPGPPRPVIPPVKELMLLRDIQTDIAETTIDLHESADDPDLETFVKELAGDQRQLMEVGASFLEKIEQGPGAPGGTDVVPPPPNGEQEQPADEANPDPEPGEEDQGDADDGGDS